jgi:hypothetical protein
MGSTWPTTDSALPEAHRAACACVRATTVTGKGPFDAIASVAQETCVWLQQRDAELPALDEKHVAQVTPAWPPRARFAIVSRRWGRTLAKE